MKREVIHDVLKDVFGPSIETKDIGGWVSICCPLSDWTHQHGRDSNPSAGVSVNENGTSIFNCFTCHNKFPFHVMLAKYAEYTGEDLGDLIEELEEEEFLGPRSLPRWDALKGGTDKAIQMPLDESIFMTLYDSAAGHPYLRKRGISDATARKLELMYDPRDSQGEPRILFPVRGPDGLLYGFSGRAIRDGVNPKVRDYHGLQKANNVLGAHLVTRDNPDKVLVVEGLFDYAATHECGYHGCAVMHSTLTKAQADILRDFGKPTYLFYDNPTIDQAGADAIETAGRQLMHYVPTMRVRYPVVEIEDDDGVHLLKDPGELTPEEIKAMIDDCRIFQPLNR